MSEGKSGDCWLQVTILENQQPEDVETMTLVVQSKLFNEKKRIHQKNTNIPNKKREEIEIGEPIKCTIKYGNKKYSLLCKVDEIEPETPPVSLRDRTNPNKRQATPSMLITGTSLLQIFLKMEFTFVYRFTF
jgi:hypothetical protein